MRAGTRDLSPTESFVAHLLAASDASDETRPQLPSTRADPKGRPVGYVGSAFAYRAPCSMSPSETMPYPRQIWRLHPCGSCVRRELPPGYLIRLLRPHGPCLHDAAVSLHSLRLPMPQSQSIPSLLYPSHPPQNWNLPRLLCGRLGPAPETEMC